MQDKIKLSNLQELVTYMFNDCYSREIYLDCSFEFESCQSMFVFGRSSHSKYCTKDIKEFDRKDFNKALQRVIDLRNIDYINMIDIQSLKSDMLH